MPTQTSTAPEQAFTARFPDERDVVVLAVPQRLQAAWAANDADAFAAVFTADGSLLLDDEQFTDRQQIRAYMAAAFDGGYRGARVTGWPLSVDHLADGVAMVVTEGGILLDGETELSLDRHIRASWVVVRRDGEWLLLSHQTSPLKG